MDLLKQLAKAIQDRTGVRSEADPSTSNIPDSHFIVSASAFWLEPDGTQRDEGYSFTENGPPILGFKMALPINVVWTWTGNGEAFRARVIYQTAENAKSFQEPFRFYGQMMKVPPGEAYDKMAAKISDFDDVNIDGVQGLTYIVLLQRNVTNDIVFAKQDDGKFLVEQAFSGHIYTEDGQRSKQS